MPAWLHRKILSQLSNYCISLPWIWCEDVRERNTVLWSWPLSWIWTQSFSYNKLPNNNMNCNVTHIHNSNYAYDSLRHLQHENKVGTSQVSKQTHQGNLLQSVSSLLCIRNPAGSVSQRLTGGSPHWYHILDMKKVAWIQSSLRRHLGVRVGLRRLCVRFISLGRARWVPGFITGIAILTSTLGDL